MSEKTQRPLNLTNSLLTSDNLMQIQQVKSVGNQPRPASLSPNTISDTNARALSTPSHVRSVQATVTRTSDVTSKVSVTFKRDPADYYFSEAIVYVSGYKGNPAPTRIASGQAPISFALENTGEAVSVTVQANGNLGPAPLQTAPNTTLKLAKTNLVTVATTAGNGTAPVSSGLTVVGTPRPGDMIRYKAYGTAEWDTAQSFSRMIAAVYSDTGTTTPNQIGIGTGVSTTGTPAGQQATATESVLLRITAASTSATLSAAVAFVHPAAGVAPFTVGTVYRSTFRFQPGQSANVRYWLGLSLNTASLTTNGMTADNPNNQYLAFRYSSTTDTTWKAVCATSNVAFTLVDTGVAIDTAAAHTFEIAVDGGATAYFYVDGVLKATISTNLPATSTKLVSFWCGDNKNNAGVAIWGQYGYVVTTYK